MTAIGLCMIVKNEAQVIRRCLDSVRPLLDYVLIEDTGSTDGTQDVIRDWLKQAGLPGEVFDEPWQDFAHNRTLALARLRENEAIDYALIMDADDVMEYGPNFDSARFKDSLSADHYFVRIRLNATLYARAQICSNHKEYRYRGVLHEYLEGAPGGQTSDTVQGMTIVAGVEGARSSDPEKYRHDAAVFERALQTETDVFLQSRYTFYLAQSYRDSGEKEKAEETYLRRAGLGFWDEEVFISLLQAADLQEALGRPFEQVMATYDRAAKCVPRRAEAAHGASRFCRHRSRHLEGYEVAKQALALVDVPVPDGLFVQPWVYHYGLLDEYAVNAYWAGHFQDCLDASVRILARDDLDQVMRDRVGANVEFARKKLAEAAVRTGATSSPTAPPARGAKSIGLCMIVRDEAHVILRCLDSVRPLIDYVLIEDTGSTDGTQRIIRGWLERTGVPGEVIEEPWHDFAINRSHALAHLRKQKDIDYALITDADDTLVLQEGFDVPAFKASLTSDLYNVEMRNGPIRYQRPQVCSNRLAFHYRGVLHEFLEGPTDGFTSGTASGLHIISGREGARNKNPDKYRLDAAVLEAALETEQDDFLRSRYTFYLARSLESAGEHEKALATYLRRADLGFWDEEVYISICEAARLQARAERPVDEVLSTYKRAIDTVPRRAEAMHGASLYCRQNGRNEEGYQIAKRGLALTEAPPPAGLFVEPWIYEYGLLDEYAVNAYWSGHYRDCLDACVRILSHPSCPEAQRQRLLNNIKFSAAKLEAGPASSGNETQGLSASHAPAAPRDLNSRVTGPPKVLLAILAKQKERVLPFYLLCIEALDYPKCSIVLYIRTNNNTDRTTDILKDWIARVRSQYADIEFETSDVPEAVEQFAVHEWNAMRFKVLARLRQESMHRVLQIECDYYFVVDVDNFIKPNTLIDLISTGLPIVAPLLRHADQTKLYSNFHEKIDNRGYFLNSDEYYWLLYQRVKGLCQVPVVHCTYLVRSDVIPQLYYDDDTARHEYVIFSDSARQHGVPQYLDTRDVYGYLTLEEETGEATKLLGPQIGARIIALRKSDKPCIFACFGLHSSGSTWMFNLVREICRTQSVDFVSLHRDSEANLPWDVLGSKLILVRSPNPFASFQSFIVSSGEPAVITVREPRDAVVSFMQRFPNSLASSFEEALNAIVLSAQTLVTLSRLRPIPVFRYEDGFVGSVETFDRIAALLGTIPTEDCRQAVLAGLAPEAVRRTISDLEAAGAIRGEKVWDKESHWHANHVGDGKVGKFKSLLSPAQQREILRHTREFCDCFGYDMTVHTGLEEQFETFGTVAEQLKG